VYRGELGEIVVDLRYPPSPLCHHSATAQPLALPQHPFLTSPFSLSPVESLIEAELQSLSSAATAGDGGSSSFESDAKSVDMEEQEEEEEEDIDFYCNESIEDLKQQHHLADETSAMMATSNVAADDLDEGFFDRPSQSRQSVIYCAARSKEAVAPMTAAATSRIRRNLLQFS
jgi:hypothetical protein